MAIIFMSMEVYSLDEMGTRLNGGYSMYLKFKALLEGLIDTNTSEVFKVQLRRHLKTVSGRIDLILVEGCTKPHFGQSSICNPEARSRYQQRHRKV
jgi:hypothetical protein